MTFTEEQMRRMLVAEERAKDIRGVVPIMFHPVTVIELLIAKGVITAEEYIEAIEKKVEKNT